MNEFSTQNLARDHIDSLVREADAEHLARLARAGRDSAPTAGRRLLGRGVRGLSNVLGAASTRLDPTLEHAHRADRRPLRV
jgi:hypothetical protein